MSHHPLSWAGSLGLDEHLLFLLLCNWKINKLHGINVQTFVQSSSHGQSHRIFNIFYFMLHIFESGLRKIGCTALEVLDSAFVPHGCA